MIGSWGVGSGSALGRDGVALSPRRPLEAQKSFRCLKAHGRLSILSKALEDHIANAMADDPLEGIMNAA